MIKHKYAELIHAWADGAEIEKKAIPSMGGMGGWHDFIGDWGCVSEFYEYRIKPQPKPDLVREALIVNSLSAGPMLYAASPTEANIVLLFDGETGKLKQCTIKGA
tara:strand:- start:151 stop:465 length:315 start_codon:yes stop_codon:yes gene_type:complete